MSFAIGTLKEGLTTLSLEGRLDGFLQITENRKAAFVFFDNSGLNCEFEWSIHPLPQSHKRVSQPRPKHKRQKLDGAPVPVPPSATHKGSWLEIPPTTHMQPRALFAGPEEQLTVDEDPDLDIADATLLEHQNRILTKANIGLERRLEMEQQRVKQLLQESRHTTQSSAWAPPPSVQEVTLSSATPPPPKPKFSPIRNPSMFLLDFVESL